MRLSPNLCAGLVVNKVHIWTLQMYTSATQVKRWKYYRQYYMFIPD